MADFFLCLPSCVWDGKCVPVRLCERMWPFMCVYVCLYLCVCGQIVMDGRSGEVSVSNMAVRVSWDRLQQMAETGRRLGELQQVCPPPRGRWRAEERKKDLKVWGEAKGGASLLFLPLQWAFREVYHQLHPQLHSAVQQRLCYWANISVRRFLKQQDTTICRSTCRELLMGF